MKQTKMDLSSIVDFIRPYIIKNEDEAMKLCIIVAYFKIDASLLYLFLDCKKL